MKCPVCNVDLVISDRQGVEIDYCPNCRGVWLDRGELDKIIDRSESWMQKDDRDDYPDRRREADRDDYRDRYRGGDHDDYYRRKRRKSFLGELFDLD